MAKKWIRKWNDMWQYRDGNQQAEVCIYRREGETSWKHGYTYTYKWFLNEYWNEDVPHGECATMEEAKEAAEAILKSRKTI